MGVPSLRFLGHYGCADRIISLNYDAVTPMLLPELKAVWDGLPSNEPEGVARALLLPLCRPEVNGKAFFVAGNQIVDFEDSLAVTQDKWMGKQLSQDINEGQRRLTP